MITSREPKECKSYNKKLKNQFWIKAIFRARNLSFVAFQNQLMIIIIQPIQEAL